MRLRSALSRLAHVPFAAAAFAVLVAAAGCADQAEGERCDPKAASSGNSDCNDGLTCQNVMLTGAPSTVYVCCPADRALSQTPACSSNSAVFDASPTPPEATPEAGDDGGTEAAQGDDGATE